LRCECRKPAQAITFRNQISESIRPAGGVVCYGWLNIVRSALGTPPVRVRERRSNG